MRSLLLLLLLAIPCYGQNGGYNTPQLGGGSPTGAAGGCLSGTYPNPTGGQCIAPNQNLQYLSQTCGTQTNCTTVKWDAGTDNASTATSGSNIVTCSNCKFQTGTLGTQYPPAVAGQIFFATDSTSAKPGANTCLSNPSIKFGGNSQTTIVSVDSDTQLHVTGNSDTTSTGKACIAWGDDDTTAINASWAAGGCTTTQMLPQGMALVSAPIWQNVNSCAYNSPGPYFGESVIGQNLGISYIIPVPNFTFTSIIGGAGTGLCTTCTAAIGNPLIFLYRNIGVAGLGVQAASTMANTALFMVGAGTRSENTNLVGWMAQGGGASLLGVQVVGFEDTISVGGINFFGSIELAVNAGNVTLFSNFITGMGSNTVGTCGMVIGQSYSNASAWGADNIVKVCLQVGTTLHPATFNSTNSNLTANTAFTTADSSCLFIGLNSTYNSDFNDQLCTTPQTNESAVNFFSTGATLFAERSQFFANGTAKVITGAASNQFIDWANNTFTGGSGTWNSLGNWLGDGAALTGVPTINSCGTTPSITGSNRYFTVTAGSGTLTSCSINFGTPVFAVTPSCQVSDSSTTVLADISAISNSAVTISGSSLTSLKLYVHCGN